MGEYVDMTFTGDMNWRHCKSDVIKSFCDIYDEELPRKLTVNLFLATSIIFCRQTALH